MRRLLNTSWQRFRTRQYFVLFMICSPKVISEIFAYYLISLDCLFPIYSLHQQREIAIQKEMVRTIFHSTSVAASDFYYKGNLSSAFRRNTLPMILRPMESWVFNRTMIFCFRKRKKATHYHFLKQLSTLGGFKNTILFVLLTKHSHYGSTVFDEEEKAYLQNLSIAEIFMSSLEEVILRCTLHWVVKLQKRSLPPQSQTWRSHVLDGFIIFI